MINRRVYFTYVFTQYQSSPCNAHLIYFYQVYPDLEEDPDSQEIQAHQDQEVLMEGLAVLDHRVGQDPPVPLDFKVPQVDQVDPDFLDLKVTLVPLEAQDLEVTYHWCNKDLT